MNLSYCLFVSYDRKFVLLFKLVFLCFMYLLCRFFINASKLLVLDSGDSSEVRAILQMKSFIVAKSYHLPKD